MLTRKTFWRTLAMVLAAAGGLASSASGQSGETDAGEVAALGGALFGAGAQPAVAGSAGVAFSRYGMALIETSFMPLGHHTIQSWPAQSTVERSYLFDFGLDFHIRMPVKERWAPYAIAGTGVLWNLVRQNSVDSFGNAVTIKFDQFNAALHTGGGLRYYVRENWGIRSEVKVIVSKQTYTRVMVGIFYVTPADWP